MEEARRYLRRVALCNCFGFHICLYWLVLVVTSIGILLYSDICGGSWMRGSGAAEML